MSAPIVIIPTQPEQLPTHVNTKVKIGKKGTTFDLPDVSPAGKAVVVFDPVTGEAGKAILALTGGGGAIPGGQVRVTRPGIPNGTFTAATTLDFIKAYFSPAVPVSCSLTVDSPIREFGAATAVVLHYHISKGDGAVTGVIVNQLSQSITVTDGTVNTTTAANTDTVFNMLAIDDNDTDSTASVQVSYHYRRFTFTSGVNYLTADNTTISNYLHTLNGQLTDTLTQDVNFTLADEYIYFAFPVEFGTVGSVMVGGLPNTAYLQNTFSYTNQFGFTATYYLYRSGGKGTGSINVKLN